MLRVRLSIILVAVLGAAGFEREALAEPNGSADAELRSRQTETEILRLRRERDETDRGPPIALLIAGSAVGVFSFALAEVHGLNGMKESSEPTSATPAGVYVVGGVGFAAAIVGLFWLFDANERRGELDERIEKLRNHAVRGPLLLPALDPAAKCAGMTLIERF